MRAPKSARFQRGLSHLRHIPSAARPFWIFRQDLWKHVETNIGFCRLGLSGGRLGASRVYPGTFQARRATPERSRDGLPWVGLGPPWLVSGRCETSRRIVHIIKKPLVLQLSLQSGSHGGPPFGKLARKSHGHGAGGALLGRLTERLGRLGGLLGAS